MIRAIVFDCFGVLASDGWLPFKRKYFGHDPALFREAGDLNKSVDSGLTTYDDFVPAVAKLAGIPVESAYEQIERNPANDELFAYIRRELKPRYQLGILSNAGENWLPEMFTAEDIALFDEIVLSYQIGITKPDAAAYQAILDKLAVEPGDCVFIDDQERYCTAATEVGMHAMLYTSVEQLKADIEKILTDSLSS